MARQRQVERRAHPRFVIDTSAAPSDRLTFLIGSERVDIADLSVRGMCLKINAADARFTVGAAVHGQVDFGGSLHIPLGLQVVNRRDDFVGCRIVDAPMLWFMEIAKIIDPIKIGELLSEIPQERIPAPAQDATAPDSQFVLRFFRGGPACDLFVWQKEDHTVHRAQLCFSWYVVEWSQTGGLKTGRVSKSPRAEPGSGFLTALTTLNPTPNEEVWIFAATILAHSSVPEEICRLFTSCALSDAHQYKIDSQ